MNQENENIEFKLKWNDEHLKTICALANSNGGELILGIDDKGIIEGVDNIENLLRDLPNKIRNKLNITPSVSTEKMKGKDIIKIKVYPSSIPISYEGRYFIRSGSTTQELKDNELANFLLEKMGKTWDSLSIDKNYVEIDSAVIDKFKSLARNRISTIADEDSFEKIFLNLKLFDENKNLTNASILLFGKDPQMIITASSVRVGRFKSPTEIIDTMIINGNLFEQVEKTIDAIKKHLNVKYEIKDIVRKDIWDYPLEAIREAVINALVHRDYLSTAEIQIKIYDDKIWIWNPGKLPQQLKVEDLKKEHSSFPRNPIIANVFYLAGFIERWGYGTKRMVELCKEQGIPEPEYIEEMGGFSVYFFKDFYTEENLRKMGLNERQIKAVMFVKEKGKITNKIYQEINGVSNKTAYLDLSELIEKGILISKGSGKMTTYILKKVMEK
jgi:ATP-dependent DNA helicase RecG